MQHLELKRASNTNGDLGTKCFLTQKDMCTRYQQRERIIRWLELNLRRILYSCFGFDLPFRKTSSFLSCTPVYQ